MGQLSDLTNQLISLEDITIQNIVICHLFSLILSLLISYTYRKNFRGVLFQDTLLLVIILITLITTTVVMVISRNLALSLGMIGALSIIRFRNAIKDPIDVIYLFWGLSVGICSGVGFFKLGFISSVFISCFIFFYSYSHIARKNSLIIITGKSSSNLTSDILKQILSLDKKGKIRSENYSDGMLEMVIETNLGTDNLPKFREFIVEKHKLNLRVVGNEVYN